MQWNGEWYYWTITDDSTHVSLQRKQTWTRMLIMLLYIAVSMVREQLPLSCCSTTLGTDVWNWNDIVSSKEKSSRTFPSRTHDNATRNGRGVFTVGYPSWCESLCDVELKIYNQRWSQRIATCSFEFLKIFLLHNNFEFLLSRSNDTFVAVTFVID
jgi:hypothetical protein